MGSAGAGLNGLCPVPEICGAPGNCKGFRQSQKMTLSCSCPGLGLRGEEEGRVQPSLSACCYGWLC